MPRFDHETSHSPSTNFGRNSQLTPGSTQSLSFFKLPCKVCIGERTRRKKKKQQRGKNRNTTTPSSEFFPSFLLFLLFLFSGSQGLLPIDHISGLIILDISVSGGGVAAYQAKSILEPRLRAGEIDLAPVGVLGSPPKKHGHQRRVLQLDGSQRVLGQEWFEHESNSWLGPSWCRVGQKKAGHVWTGLDKGNDVAGFLLVSDLTRAERELREQPGCLVRKPYGPL